MGNRKTNWPNVARFGSSGKAEIHRRIRTRKGKFSKKYYTKLAKCGAPVDKQKITKELKQEKVELANGLKTDKIVFRLNTQNL